MTGFQPIAGSLRAYRSARNVRRTPWHKHSIILFSYRQYSVVQWCLIPASFVRFFIFDAVTRVRWSSTIHCNHAEGAIHLTTSLMVSLLSAEQYFWSHAYQLISSFISNKYFKTSAAESPMNKKSAWLWSFGRCPSTADCKEHGILSPVLRKIQCRHTCPMSWMPSPCQFHKIASAT